MNASAAAAAALSSHPPVIRSPARRLFLFCVGIKIGKYTRQLLNIVFVHSGRDAVSYTCAPVFNIQ